MGPDLVTLTACPACGAALRPGAPWCTLCYADLRTAPEPDHAPTIGAYAEPALALLSVSGVPFAPGERVTDCRDPKDDLFLELALASGAGILVSSDNDLLVLHPWRGVRILRPAEYLAETEGRG